MLRPDRRKGNEMPYQDVHDTLWLDGRRAVASGGETFSVDNSFTEEITSAYRTASSADIDKAVAVARNAQSAWSHVPADERVEVVSRAATILESQGAELARVIVGEVGTVIADAVPLQVGLGVTAMRESAAFAGEALAERSVRSAKIVKVPVGVAAAITPWNYPIFQLVLKVVPAIISGSSVVLKPSEVAPQTAFAVAEALEGAGLPAGVLNIVNGLGPSVGAALAEHGGVDIVSFTGSVPTGRKVAAAAARHGARSTLELGGKSASLVLQAEQLEAAVRFTVANCMSNAGQTCAALSRLLVPREQLAETVDLVREIIDALIVGDPYDASTQVGPLASRKQQTAVLRLIREASEQGSELVAGGNVDDLPSTGWFVPPTAFVASSESLIAQTEVFGPVITILSYESVAEAITIANATRFGLIARAWTDNQQQFEDVAQSLQAGSVMKNDVRTVWAAPFGGVKDSGYGRERGAYGIEEYLVTKSLQF